MSLVQLHYYCPCCGYPDLKMPAYRDLGQPPWLDHGLPPYEDRYGPASYDVCPCCGFEFGNDDNPGISEPVTFEEYRNEWIAGGCKWFDETKRPTEWSFREQLCRIGVVSNM